MAEARAPEQPPLEQLPRWAPPVLAVQFLTRLPVPDTGRLSASQVQRGLVRAVGWFPLVGAAIGLVTAAVLAKDIGAGVRPATVVKGLLAAMPGLIAMLLLMPLHLLGAVLLAAVFLLWFRRLLLRRIGGSTGDCLGFAAYAGQLLFLLAAVAG